MMQWPGLANLTLPCVVQRELVAGPVEALLEAAAGCREAEEASSASVSVPVAVAPPAVVIEPIEPGAEVACRTYLRQEARTPQSSAAGDDRLGRGVGRGGLRGEPDHADAFADQGAFEAELLLQRGGRLGGQPQRCLR